MAREIPHRRRDGSIRGHTTIDEADFEWLNQWRWSRNNYGYAVRNIGGRRNRYTLLMSRLILGLERGDPRQAEHINRDPSDCQRSNLRVAERAAADNKQNLGVALNNTSGHRGVHWAKKERKWQAYGKVDRKQHYLGFHVVELDAARAAEAFRREHMPFAVHDLTLDPVPPCPCRMCRV